MSRRASPRTNLPVERGAFIGRVKLLDRIARQFDGGARIVSLVGPEGIGKTRLALRAGALEMPRFGGRGGVWFVDGTAITSSGEFVRALLLHQGLLPAPGMPPEGELRRAIESVASLGPSLFILDGLDRDTTDVATTTARLLADAPDLRLIVTSRGSLAVPDAAVLEVGSLALGKQPGRSRDKNDRNDKNTATSHEAHLRALAAAEAVQLFIARAGEARRGFAPTPAELMAVAQIVRQLDGVPLAIEIAAARLRALAPSELLERLPRNVGLLVSAPAGNAGTSPAKRSTLAGAVAWSLDLLAAWEQSALAQAAIFRGGFDLAAAEAVMDLSQFADAPSVQSAVDSLLEKALLRVQEPVGRWRTEDVLPEARRLEMPTVVREFADARLGSGVIREALSHRHAAHYVRVGGGWAENVDGHGGTTLRRQLELEAENLLAAVRRALRADPPSLASVSTALLGSLALEPVLTTRGPHELFLDLLDRTIEPAEVVGAPLALLARAHEARGRALRARHELARSLPDFEAALSYARRAREKVLEARARANIGTHHLQLRNFDVAAIEYDATLQLFEEVGERRVYGRALGHYALLDLERGELERAVVRYNEALKILREVGDRRWEAIECGQLGVALLELGKLDDARTQLKRALAIHKELHNRRMEGIALAWLGDASAESGEIEEAHALWERALERHREVGDPKGEACALARLGALAERGGLHDKGRELFQRARVVVERAADRQLTLVVDILEGRADTQDADDLGEAARGAGRLVRALA